MRYRMLELLQGGENRELPTEYLLSRIRGRRAHLISDWGSLIVSNAPFDYLTSPRYMGFVTEKSPEGLWRDLMKEFRWVYFQMNSILLEIFRPFFLYSELRTLFMCLRFIRERKALRITDILAVSILSDKIKKILRESTDVTSAVKEISEIFTSMSVILTVPEKMDAEGQGRFEQQLTNKYLVSIITAGLHPVMLGFFIRIIDARNIISLFKYIKLKTKAAPPFIPCGNISQAVFTELLRKKDMTYVDGLVRKLTGIRLEDVGVHVENSLYRHITAYLKRAGREPLGIGPVLEYLWRCSTETMNLSILFHGREIEREIISAELIS